MPEGGDCQGGLAVEVVPRSGSGDKRTPGNRRVSEGGLERPIGVAGKSAGREQAYSPNHTMAVSQAPCRIDGDTRVGLHMVAA